MGTEPQCWTLSHVVVPTCTYWGHRHCWRIGSKEGTNPNVTIFKVVVELVHH